MQAIGLGKANRVLGKKDERESSLVFSESPYSTGVSC